jgi:hypothetical protein
VKGKDNLSKDFFAEIVKKVLDGKDFCDIITLVLRNQTQLAGVAEWQTHLTQNQAGNTVGVQVPSPAPNRYNPNLFPVGDEFGLFVLTEKGERCKCKSAGRRPPYN